MPQTRAGLAHDHLLRGAVQPGPGIGYPLAAGPIKFDSGQLGYGTGFSREVTTGSNIYTTPPLTKPRQDIHVLLPNPSVHARLDPGRGRQVR